STWTFEHIRRTNLVTWQTQSCAGRPGVGASSICKCWRRRLRRIIGRYWQSYRKWNKRTTKVRNEKHGHTAVLPGCGRDRTGCLVGTEINSDTICAIITSLKEHLQRLVELQARQNELLERYLWRIRFSLLTLLLL